MGMASSGLWFSLEKTQAPAPSLSLHGSAFTGEKTHAPETLSLLEPGPKDISTWADPPLSLTLTDWLRTFLFLTSKKATLTPKQEDIKQQHRNVIILIKKKKSVAQDKFPPSCPPPPDFLVPLMLSFLGFHSF